MLLIALVAITYTAARRLIVGDGGVDVEIVNGMGAHIHDVRLICRGRESAARSLAPGASTRSRLWPGVYRKGGSMDGSFGLAYTAGGSDHRWNPGFTFDLLRNEPAVRVVIAERDGQEAWNLTFPGAKVSDGKRKLREWWFWLLPPGQ
ncbi:hypothetical protein TA3x_001585 [Tundrisphaera sp. TA3]|uniref:hypothetical protein n=1 Tax=Tundrisphaera sp. TA3 TaxID=3435775 RepID=UPI003EBF99EB